MRPSLEEVKELAKKFSMIPISTEILSDSTTPIEALKHIRQVSKHVFLLESAEANKVWGRYSFLGYDPMAQVTVKDGKGMCHSEGITQHFEGDPANVIRKMLQANHSPKLPYLPPFTGGFVGYYSYDYIKYQEPKLTLSALDHEGFEDADLMMFDKVIAFDSYRQKIVLIVNMHIDAQSHSELEKLYQEAQKNLEHMKSILTKDHAKEAIHEQSENLELLSPFQELYDKETYCEMVERAQHYIKEGDIFQVVLSNRVEAKMRGSLLPAYRLLRTTNPSPYMFYFSGSEGEIIGASPETLVKQVDGVVTTFPMAGTRRRGETQEEDLLLEQDLLSDEKELAEHNMLVDLGRNDLGKLCEIGTVEVEKYLNIERFSHVMHIGSCVKGQLLQNKDALDVIAGVLPAGTLSGAPKI
ncbi:MAG: chorismate-binding protein, partial [Lachnospiraceae bacterium]|nr:chorismate-binding protein [Lachnospiraceae bacterium]